MNKAFVLGNGRSRLAVNLLSLQRQGKIYGCNALYREFVPDVLIATDRPIAEAIQHSGYSAVNVFYTRRPMPGYGARRIPQDWYGFSSGPVAAAVAAQQGHPEIYLLGFDLGGLPGDRLNNIYADTEFYKRGSARATYAGNWVRQIKQILQQFQHTQFYRIFGDNTAMIAEFDAHPNLENLTMIQFLELINNITEDPSIK